MHISPQSGAFQREQPTAKREMIISTFSLPTYFNTYIHISQRIENPWGFCFFWRVRTGALHLSQELFIYHRKRCFKLQESKLKPQMIVIDTDVMFMLHPPPSHHLHQHMEKQKHNPPPPPPVGWMFDRKKTQMRTSKSMLVLYCRSISSIFC